MAIEKLISILINFFKINFQFFKVINEYFILISF